MPPNKSSRRWRCQFRCRGSRRESAVAQLSTLLSYLGFARQPLIAWLNQPCLAGQTQIQTLLFPFLAAFSTSQWSGPG